VIQVSVVIPSFNTREVLLRALASFQQTVDGFPSEVIVVDNGSGDGSADAVAEKFPGVKLIRNAGNRGFARAVNQGLRAARGSYYLLLNSDTEMAGPFLGTLVRYLEAHPDVAVAAPRLLNSDGSDQGTARTFPTWSAYLFGRRSPLTRLWPQNPFSSRYLVGRHRQDPGSFDVDIVSAACMLVRAEAVRQIGLLDEGFFMYWEDEDWCRRFRRAGWRVCCVPSVSVVHHEGASSRLLRRRLIVEMHRGAYRYFQKHHARGRWWLAALVALALIVRAAALLAGDVVRAGMQRVAGRRGASAASTVTPSSSTDQAGIVPAGRTGR